MTGALLLFLASVAVPRTEVSRPDWCRPGYVCLTTERAVEATVALADLQAENDALRAKRLSRWGWVAGCGPAASLSVEDGKTTLAGTLSCMVGLGLKF